MTATKHIVPRSSNLTFNENETFERYADADLKRVAPDYWDGLEALWRQLPIAYPATRRRLLGKAVRICAKTGFALPRRLIVALQSELSVRDPRASASKRSLAPALDGYFSQPKAISSRDLARICKVLYSPSTARSRPRSEVNFQNAARLYARGLSLRSIAKQLSLDRNQSTIYGYTKQREFGLEVRDEITRLQVRLHRLGDMLADFALSCASSKI